MTDRVEMHPDTLSRRKLLDEHHDRVVSDDNTKSATAAQVAASSDPETDPPEVKKPK